MENFIAERKLLYSSKGDVLKKELIIRLGAPYSVKEGMVDFSVGKDGCFACHVEIAGIDERYPEVYGADSMQAIELAVNAVEDFLKRLHKKYDFYFLSGESYF